MKYIYTSLVMIIIMSFISVSATEFNLPLNWVKNQSGTSVDANNNGIIDMAENASNSFLLQNQASNYYRNQTGFNAGNITSGLIPDVRIANASVWHNQTTTFNSFATGVYNNITAMQTGKGSIGNCPYGQVVMNITNSTIQCVTVGTGSGSGNVTISGTANYIPLITNATNIGNSVMYQNSNYVGINTTGALAPLHIFTTANTTNGMIYLRRDFLSTSNYLIFHPGGQFFSTYPPTQDMTVNSIQSTGSSSTPLAFVVGNGEIARLSGVGLGILTKSPLYALHVNGTILLENNNYLRIKSSTGSNVPIIGMTSADNVNIAGVSGTSDISIDGAQNFVYKGSTSVVSVGRSTPLSGGRFYVNGSIRLDSDNQKYYVGNANDASITYDGTNMVITPNEVGTGSVVFNKGNAGGTAIMINRTTLTPGMGNVRIDIGQDNAAQASLIRLVGNQANYADTGIILQSNNGSSARGGGVFMNDATSNNSYFMGKMYSLNRWGVSYQNNAGANGWNENTSHYISTILGINGPSNYVIINPPGTQSGQEELSMWDSKADGTVQLGMRTSLLGNISTDGLLIGQSNTESFIKAQEVLPFNIYCGTSNSCLRINTTTGEVRLSNLSGTYTGGSAYVCVYDNGTLYTSEVSC